jgi:zinc transport system ATP-binding protein
MSSNDSILTADRLCFSYGSRTVLEDVSFSINATDFLAVIGPNGGGKSTLIKIILGLEIPDSGSVSVFGHSPEVGRDLVGYLPQYSNLDLDYPISAIEVVLMATLIRNPFKRYTKADKAAALAAMDRTNSVEFANRSFGELSGGERQRVLLARALLKQPKLLILDEPSNNLDSHNEYCLYEVLESLNKDTAVMMVSHDISAVSRAVKTIACLNRRMVFHGEKQLMPKDIEMAYCCHMDLIGHTHSHRHLETHDDV